MTRSQYAEIARSLRTEGGFTVNANTGQSVSSGYAVAAYLARSAQINGTCKITDLAGFVQANADALSINGNVFGGWLDTATGTTWLDVSTVIDNRSAAITAAQALNQIAIFNLTTGTEINTGGTGS